MTESSPLETIRLLLNSLLNNEISVEVFCIEFEKSYNFELRQLHLSDNAHIALESLFNKVVYFSPFPNERQQIPNYLDEQEILTAARETRDKLLLI
jgi:hypothetical protein